MFESIDDYIHFNKEDSEKVGFNTFIVKIKAGVDSDKIDRDLEELRIALTNLSKLLDKKFVFVVDRDKVEIFEKSTN